MSLEDREAVAIVQRAVLRDPDNSSCIAMGGGRTENSAHLMTQAFIVGFWEHDKTLMKIAEHPARASHLT